MKDQWLAMEHYRLHAVEDWPDSPHKRGELAAIRSSLESLLRSGAHPIDCHTCLSRKHRLALVVELPLAA
jgi:hypothetical protein